MFLRVKKTNYDTGVWAETLATCLLFLKGYKVLNRRYKTSYGEIDIVAAKGKSLHFIEVKKRDNQEKALYAITPYQRRRIENTAKIYLSRLAKQHFEDIHFDAIIICNYLNLKHIISAWRVGDSQ